MATLLKVNAHSNWDLYLGANNRIVVIPNERAALDGCKASHYGDKLHVAAMMNRGNFDWDGFTDAGIEHFSGLIYKVLCHHSRPMIKCGYRFATANGI